MRRIEELIDRRHAHETVTAVDEGARVAREGHGIAGNRDHRRHGRCRQLARLRLGALPRRIEHHGVGPFALRLADRARVTAVDNDADAITALRHAAAGTRGLKPVATQVRDLFRSPLAPAELKRFDAVLFDPPRQGAEAQARALAASTVPTVVAVSCNPVTFARDARILVDGGYRLMRVTPVDQFRYSPHVELVGRFER